MWEVEYTEQFADWWYDLSERQQESSRRVVDLLVRAGPALGYPYSSEIKGSRHSHMRELRVQSGGSPLRIFYAFDPRRSAILLIGGDKTGDNRFYRRYVPMADDLYDEYIEELRREGLI